ncbi:MAG: sulfurtransferase [Phyllobacteriaceae bacterium]|nr:sulfurtransferase [Phyllobacteriaceae bacterium]MBA89460.1 sulfurtransferase [Phyllobacteriaceae bacterium]|tara:strand:+ start:119 stop:535 length:417 start_codon:yes stop_codon:yes gene_type:complete
MRILAVILALLLSAGSAIAVEKITPRQAHEAVGEGGLVLVDIRTPEEWAETGIPEPATPIDMTSADFVPKLKELLTGNPGRTVGFICRTGNRSNYLTEVLEKAGLTNIVDVTGGVAGNGKVTGWIAEGLPMKQHCETC